MIQSIDRSSPLEAWYRFLESCNHQTTFLLVFRGLGDELIGIYAGHTKESITLREAGEESGDKTRRVIPLAEVEKIEVT